MTYPCSAFVCSLRPFTGLSSLFASRELCHSLARTMCLPPPRPCLPTPSPSAPLMSISYYPHSHPPCLLSKNNASRCIPRPPAPTGTSALLSLLFSSAPPIPVCPVYHSARYCVSVFSLATPHIQILRSVPAIIPSRSIYYISSTLFSEKLPSIIHLERFRLRESVVHTPHDVCRCREVRAECGMDEVYGK